MCCKNHNSEPERSGPMAEGNFISSATCDRCLKGIDDRLEGIKDDLQEVKDLIGEDKKASNRRVMMWIAAVAALSGILSNLDKFAKLLH